jgi:flagellar hook assembly protein FlgD
VNYEIKQNYPNPFNPSTTIEFSLPRKSRVKIVVTNILGKTVAVLLDEIKSAGTYSLPWNGLDDLGQPAASGVYFYLFETEEFYDSKKMILLR